MSNTPSIVLSIAGSDSSAGAGIQADLKTFSALGVYGATAITAITAQNTLGVTAIHPVPGDVIAAQIDAIFADLPVKAVKIGMLGGGEAIEAVSRGLRRWAKRIPIVLDPVMVSTSGSFLLERDALEALTGRLFTLAALITPNLLEAGALLGAPAPAKESEMRAQAVRLLALGPRAVLVKGGHGSGEEAADIYYDGTMFRRYAAPRIASRNTHGTGCTLASAIAAFLAKGYPMQDSIAEAKSYVQGAIEHAAGLRIGAGQGPLAHFYLNPAEGT